MAQQQYLENLLFNSFERFKEQTLTVRRFKQKEILRLIQKRKDNLLFEITTVGESFEGRSIEMLKIGNGPRRILLWSQMHGDEATATMAFFDIFNFLEATNDGFDDLRNEVFTNTTLYFVPMLNPDGAERFQRFNAQEIDVNRDALALQAPESRILKYLQQTLQPEFGFNMHDKNPRYSVGRSDKLATISFLATAYDMERSINNVRKKSMQLIVVMNRALQRYIQDQVGKWSEEYEPRAFGDNIQQWGTTLILIESGGYAGDPEKQFIRKLNFTAVITALASIAKNTFASEEVEEYHQLQENSRYIFDLLIANATVEKNGKSFQADLGINRNEVNQDNASSFFHRSMIEDFGDLSIFSGTETFNASGLTIEPGKVYPTVFENLETMEEQRIWSLLGEGYTYFEVRNLSPEIRSVQLPIHIVRIKTSVSGNPGPESAATFILTKDGQVKYAIVNGFVYDINESYRLLGNGIVT